MKLYDFKVKDNKNENVSLEKYQGKVVMIVNTATKCGLTNQYEELEQLYQKYRDAGLEILDFPCNQFLKQAPLNDEEINSFCQLKYNTTFDRFKKVDINGQTSIPLYQWLKEQISEDTNDSSSKKFEKTVKLFTLGNKPNDIKWNFTKFLVDQNGHVVFRFGPTYPMEKIEAEIKKLLASE